MIRLASYGPGAKWAGGGLKWRSELAWLVGAARKTSGTRWRRGTSGSGIRLRRGGCFGGHDHCRQIEQDLGPVGVLVNSAGTNVPRRALAELSLEDYHRMIATNLHGAFYFVQAVLPGMRERGEGTIVNIVSDAGKLASPKAGPGYVMSKFGLAGLTQSINAEERARGIRACAIFPGDIDTPLLEKRPQPPDAAARQRMMRAEDVAECVLFCLQLPPRVIVEEMLVRPR